MTRRAPRGFTLIEVLIALLILAIALAAVVEAMTDNTRNLAALEDRTQAHWVGMNIVASAQTGLLPAPTAGEPLTGKSDMLGKTWYWTLGVDNADDPYTLRVYVDVAPEENAKPLSHLIAFVRRTPGADAT